MIWTALPAAAVLQFGGVSVESTAPSEVRIGHRILQVIPHGHGRSQVVRLISGDPRDYLDRRWQPGAIIDPP